MRTRGTRDGTDDLVMHEALQVVQTVAPGFGAISCEPLKRGKSDVFTVHGAGGVAPLVAKCSREDTISVEHRVLTWLETAPFPTVRPAGTMSASRPGRAWLVSEFAGGEPYRRDSPPHRRVAGTWMGDLHVWSASVTAPDLPQRGPAYHRDVVREACATLADALGAGVALTAGARSTIRRLEQVGRDVLDRWGDLYAVLSALPTALVHSGIAGKNLRITADPRAPAVLAFDWEAAGWGCPAADLSAVDLESYAVRARRGGIELPPARLVHAVGELLWCFAGVPGERSNLLGSWPDRAVAKLEVYLERSRASMRVVRGRTSTGVSSGAAFDAPPPLQAWAALSLPWPVLERAEPVQRKKRKAEVWRLSGPKVGDQVIAKRCRQHEAAREELVYCTVLPRVGMGTGQYLGRVDTGDGRTAWLFVREIVGTTYTADEPLHRDLATRWLAALHSATHDDRGVEGLPDVGPTRYRVMLEELVRTLPEAARNPALGTWDIGVIDAMANCCRELTEQWPHVERAVGPLPRTLVHGSFSARNMLVTSTAAGPALRVFDWGAAGWGIPARDLWKLVSPNIGGSIAAYWRDFPVVPADHRPLIVAVGHLFRAIEHITWVAPQLREPHVEEPMRKAASHRVELLAAREALERLL